MKRAFAIAAVAVASACTGGGAAVADVAPFVLGSATDQHLAVGGDGRSITLLRGDTALLSFDAAAFQLGVTDGLLDQASWDPYQIAQRGEDESNVAFLTATSLHAREDGDGVTLDLAYDGGFTLMASVKPVQDARFSVELRPADPAGGDKHVALVRVVAKTSPDATEGLYGLGEYEDAVDNRGKLRSMQMEPDPLSESADNEAHIPIPLLLGTHGWGMFVASTRVGAFDVATQDARTIVTTYAVNRVPRGTAALPLAPQPDLGTAGPEPLLFYLFAAPVPLDLVKHYYDLTGAPKLPPAWAYGPWIWRDENKDQAEVLSDVVQMRTLDLATSGIWIDHPYSTSIGSFDYDKTRYTDVPSMIAKVHAAGLSYALWHVPYLEKTSPLRAEADGKGYFPPGTSIPLNPWSNPVDFTNEDAYAFWLTNLKSYTAQGVVGFKLDYAEDIVPALGLARNGWAFADGSDERTGHHEYARLYHQVYADSIDGDHFLLCRAAKWGEQALGLVIWPGDMDASFTHHGETFTPADETKAVVGVGGLPATVVQGITLGVSGFPFFGADTGGYRHSPPDNELYVRWFEQTALSTVMEVGDSSSQPPWVYTPENGRSDATVDIYRTYARLHLRLFPYVWSLAQKLVTDGRPIQRAVGFAYPELGVHPSDEYMLGDDLLVAPVVTRGETTKNAVVPAGTWVDWWSGQTYDVGADAKLAIAAPLETLPLLMRDGAIVPMLRSTIDTLSPATDPGVESFANDAGLLWARIAPGRARRFDVWDGSAIERTDAGVIAVTSGSVFTSGFVVELIATPKPAGVARDGESDIPAVTDFTALDAATEGWAWDPGVNGTLRVKVPGGATRIVVR